MGRSEVKIVEKRRSGAVARTNLMESIDEKTLAVKGKEKKKKKKRIFN